MGLESGTYISDLVTTNPLNTDSVSQGDDHLRLLKTTIQNTFPNISGAMTATHTELNLLTGKTAANFLQSGMILIWSGAISAIPTGWSLCNGLSGNPDLRNKIIIGSEQDAGGQHDVGDTANTFSSQGVITSDSTTATGSTSGTVGSHTLTTAEMPSHTHTMDCHDTDDSNNNIVIAQGTTSTFVRTSNATGGGGSHTHTWSGSITMDGHTHTIKVPYYSLAYIIKD